MRRWVLLVAGMALCCVEVGAQTYTPKQIRVEAPSGTDTAEALKIVDLKQGVPLTKEEIEAGLQRLVDTGLYKDVGYKVDSEALVIQLMPSASTQLQPVRYENFVWWKPEELEGLVESRVAAFHGKLPLAGTLTEQVKSALVAMLKEKGVDAEVSARQFAGVILLSISRPKVAVGSVALSGTTASIGADVEKLKRRLKGDDFEMTETSRAVDESVGDLEQNTGYLDVQTSALTISAPVKAGEGYAVDVSAAVTPGAIYRVSRLTITAAAPVSPGELEKTAEIKTGDAASPLALRIAKGETEKAYSERGYLDAQAQIETAKDSAAHTVAYTIGFAPGQVYRFGSVDASALTPEQQSRIAKEFHATPATVADKELAAALFRVMGDAHLERAVTLSLNPDRGSHTVAYVLKPMRKAVP